MPPLAGVKTASNVWLHQFDFRTPNTHGCEMSKQIGSGVKRKGARAGARGGAGGGATPTPPSPPRSRGREGTAVEAAADEEAAAEVVAAYADDDDEEREAAREL